MPKKVTTESFTKMALEKHDDFYKYEKVQYVRSKEDVIITCPLHGDFNQLPSDHLQGKGCIKCGWKTVETKITKNTEYFIEKAIKIHSSKYDYRKVEYLKSSEKVIIECPSHGEFKQRPADHLKNIGCPKCGKESHWRRSDYIKKAGIKLCTFYTIRCFNENEEFYKVGITMNSVYSRYNSLLKMPYTYEVISEIRGEAGFIWDLELQEKRKLKVFKYKPMLKFNGSKTECFTKYKI